MTAIEFKHAEIGTVSSRADGSVTFRVMTPELRPSEAGVVMSYHGKACSVFIKPHEQAPDELVQVETEREQKTPSQRLRSVLFLLHKERNERQPFNLWYAEKMEALITSVKDQLSA